MKDKIIEFDRIDRNGPQECDIVIDLSPENLDPDTVERADPAHLKVRVERGDLEGEYVASGTIQATADLRCSRCLGAVPFASESEFTVRYRPRSENPESEIEVYVGELDVEFYDERSISLAELAREMVDVAVPMKVLCSEACRGLCPHCHANLNEGPCDCEPTTDVRWGSLRAVRDSLTENES